MKRLLLMRHAEAVWESNGQTDFDRPLTVRGESDAAAAGREVASAGFMPDAVVASPAKRALRTAELFVEGANIAVDIRRDRRIYEATPQTLCEIVAEFDGSVEASVLVGHNPGFEALAAYLTGSLTPMRPGSIAVIDLHITQWCQIEHGSGAIARLVQPCISTDK